MAANNDVVFLLQGDQLVELSRVPYSLEDHFQAHLAQHPELLGGGQYMGTEPRRWLLVTRELPVPDKADGSGRWSLDHLFVDQDATPTLVEVKRASDTRLRREVVGQMLDYAANGIRYWPVGVLRQRWESSLGGADPREAIESFAGRDADQFWGEVEDNLRTGRVRMLFVSESIPTELQTIIEYLNEQMANAEVLGVAIARYEGQGLSLLVPRVVGSSARLQRTKQAARGRSYEEYLVDGGEVAVEVDDRLRELAEEHGLQTRRTPAALQVRTALGDRDAAQYYPGFRLITLNLEPLRSRGHEALATAILEEASTITLRPLTEKQPNIPLDDALREWGRVEAIIVRIASAG